jgi:hypothetical protein
MHEPERRFSSDTDLVHQALVSSVFTASGYYPERVSDTLL